jgi:alcohol dehydrogenase class IV
MHALAHALGGKHNCAHGLLNAVLMPYVLVANRQVIEDKIDYLAKQLAIEPATFDGFITWLLLLRQQLQIPHTLAEVGITSINHQEIAQLAVADATAATNPIDFSNQQYMTILENAIAGTLVACA